MSGRLQRRRRAVLVTVGMVAGLLALAPGQAAEAQESGCAPGGSNFSSSGPFTVTTDETSVTTFYSPNSLGSQGCAQHPVIIWGNGTFTTPVIYDGFLRHLASHGFIVAAANTSNAGSGEEMLQGIDQLETWNGQAGHRFNGKVDLGNVASTGHSQGAAGAFRAAEDPRVGSTFPINGPGSQPQNVDSVLYLSGETDPFAAAMTGAYNSSSKPAALVELAGAGHLVALGNAGAYRGPATAWARWMLMGDSNGAQQFQGSGCGLCNSGDLSDFQANSQLQAYDSGNGGEEPPPGTEPPPPGEEECGFLASLFGLCGDECGFFSRLFGLCE